MSPAPRAAVDIRELARFLTERAVTDPDALVPVRDLYSEWLHWAADREVWTAGINTFTRDVQAAAPAVRVYRPRDRTGRKLPRHYRGITLETR